MARAVIQLAAIATCVVLSLTAEDRQARSGDLDRGPPFGREVREVNLFGEGGELLFPFGVRNSAAEELDEDALSPPFEGLAQDGGYLKRTNSKNRHTRLSGDEQQYDFGAGNFQFPVDYQEPYYIEGKPFSTVQNLNREKFKAKTDARRENENSSEILKSDIDFGKYNLEALNNNKSARLGQSPRASSGNIEKILSELQNFRENASPPSLTKTDQSSLEFGDKEKNWKSKSAPEISFEAVDEEAMALRRHFEMSTEFFLVPSTSTNAATSTATVQVIKSVYSGDADKIIGVFRNEVWVVPVLALSAITMALIGGFEIFVLCKAWKTTPSRRHLFLGQMLLLGLFSCAGLASIYAASPTQLTCALMRFGTGVAYAIVFASLLVKCVFLISLNGGVYLPAPYQGLLLLFAILIQVAIGIQWLLTSPPIVDAVTVEHIVHPSRNRLLVTAADISTTQVIPLCRTPYTDMLLSLIYVIFLIIFVTVLAVKSRGIRDNYREATYIGLSVGCSILTWLIWTVSGLIVSERHRDASIAFGLVISSIMVFLIMFMPKGRQLAAMGKEGVYIEDREERFSSLSRAGSGYSPSFFHFKPIKYGMNHGTKHQPIATLRAGGKFV